MKDLQYELKEKTNEKIEDYKLHLNEFKLTFIKLETVIQDMNDPIFWL